MTDRLFVPAAFAGLLATMPPATALPQVRADWLTTAYQRVRAEFPGSHGLSAMPLAHALRTELAATTDELTTTGSSALAA